MCHSKSCVFFTALTFVLTASTSQAQQPTVPPEVQAKIDQAKAAGKAEPPEFPKFEEVAKDYEKVISTADGQKSLYTLWKREKDGQMLAELPRNPEKQNLFFAYTIAGGVTTAGEQVGDMYVNWRRYDKRLALVQPNVAVRTTGDLESQKAHKRVFTDRVLLDIPILCYGPGGGLVIDLDALLVGQAARFFGYRATGVNTRLVKIAKAKAFPENIEVAFELPLSRGQLGTLYYSISLIPDTNGYKPRTADERVGYFATTHMDVGDASADTPWVRQINRWRLEKADPKLRMSPPKQPIVFHLEHTIPVRYRRWVREGLLEWNKAYEKVGIVNAIEAYQQDARTGAHMEKDPEDVRFNFIIWTNAMTGYAIGPSRVDPRTGEILDADVSLTEEFITGWTASWKRYMADRAMVSFGPETLAWLQTRPQWDPRVRLASPSQRPAILAQLARQRMMSNTAYASHPAAMSDPTLIGDDPFDGLSGRISQVNGACLNGISKSMDISLFRLNPKLLSALLMPRQDDDGESGNEDDDAEEEKVEDDVDLLDGVPDWFIGPLLKDLVMHEVGHILGLRHNFKASSAYGMDVINSEEHKLNPITGSVMDYLPTNFNFDEEKEQGAFAMVTIGPYDYWAIEYGYTFGEPSETLKRVSEPELAYATDEDIWGPDPLALTDDLGTDSIEYAEDQMKLVNTMRGDILEKMVEDGESWSKAREGYEILLSKHFSSISIASNWVGGSFVNRDRKGDPGGRDPVVNVPAEQQRRSLQFVIENAFEDDAFGLSSELLSKMTIDKWWDAGGFSSIFEDSTWPVHDQILGIQAAALSMLLNPTTLNRVFDNEFRSGEEEDALTLPEVIYGISDAVWLELDAPASRNYTARSPMISSLRRNLQREYIERLIDLSLPNGMFGAASKPVSNLSVYQLRELQRTIEKTLNRSGSRLDPYSVAHLTEAQMRIEKALDAQYIYNADDIGGGGFGMPFFFIQPASENKND